MATTDAAERLRRLKEHLTTRAKQLGMKPGSKPWHSYVSGTLERERKRLTGVAIEKRK